MSDDIQQQILQIVDQVQYTGTKLDQLAKQVQALTSEQAELNRAIGGFFSVTTVLELATAAAIVMSAVSIYLLTKWRGERPHEYGLPLDVNLPPARVEEAAADAEAEALEMYRRKRPKDEADIDTLAELARALMQEKPR